MSTYDNYPRDLVGYGRTPPHARWPGGARVALQFVQIPNVIKFGITPNLGIRQLHGQGFDKSAHR